MTRDGQSQPAKSRASAGRFKPGQSGNPAGRKKGSKNRATREIKEFAQRILGDERYERALCERLYAGKLHPAVETTLLHYAYGKPVERIEHSGEVSFAQVVVGLHGRGQPSEGDR